VLFEAVKEYLSAYVVIDTAAFEGEDSGIRTAVRRAEGRYAQDTFQVGMTGTPLARILDRLHPKEVAAIAHKHCENLIRELRARAQNPSENGRPIKSRVARPRERSGKEHPLRRATSAPIGGDLTA
jgi:hypothetical protein